MYKYNGSKAVIGDWRNRIPPITESARTHTRTKNREINTQEVKDEGEMENGVSEREGEETVKKSEHTVKLTPLVHDNWVEMIWKQQKLIESVRIVCVCAHTHYTQRTEFPPLPTQRVSFIGSLE